MKKFLLCLTLSAGILTTSLAQRTPQASPGATLIQSVGVTDFTITYSRPSIKGRTVFADSSVLAPYNELWRTGANMATTLESNTAFTFGGKSVPAGKYALFSIPSGSAWTLLLNKNHTQPGTNNYSQDDDVASVKVAPISAEYTESFEISFSDIKESSANLNLNWSSVQIPVVITVETEALTLHSLNQAVAEKPEDVATLQSAAGFMMSKGKDLPQALSLADKAIGLKESFSNLWLKAQILGKLGKYAEALPVAQKALALGGTSGDSSFGFYKGQIEKGIADIQSKLPAVKAVGSAVKGKLKK